MINIISLTKYRDAILIKKENSRYIHKPQSFYIIYCSGFYKTKNITSIGKCLMVKDDLELSGHCFFNITLMSPENKRLRTEVIEFESRHFGKY
jgi:hypothetical protein